MIDRRSGEPLRVVYFGTPAFAVPALEALADDGRFSIELVVTQPDRPSGRGGKLTSPPVKQRALASGLPVYQPASLRGAEDRAPLEAVGADVFVVAAYGLIFGRKTLAIPRLGAVNLHASLLPRYRGASPIGAAILERRERTGVTVMLMDAGLDTGPMLESREVAIAPDDTTESLTVRLAALGAEMAPDALVAYAAGANAPVPQSGEASLTRPLVRADGLIDWRSGADDIEAFARAMWPWPRASTTIAGRDGASGSFQVHRVTPIVDRIAPRGEPGETRKHGSEIVVATGDGWLRLDTVQVPGKRPMPGAALLAGRHLREGDVLESRDGPHDPPLIRPVAGS